MVSCLIFKSLNYFEFVFLNVMRECPNFIALHVAIPFSQHHLLKRLSFFHCIFLPPLSYINWSQVCGFIFALYILLHWYIIYIYIYYIYIYLCQYYAVLITVIKATIKLSACFSFVSFVLCPHFFFSCLLLALSFFVFWQDWVFLWF